MQTVRRTDESMLRGWRWTRLDNTNRFVVDRTIAALAGNPEEAGFTVIKWNPARTVLSGESDCPVIIKQYRVRSFAERLKYLFVSSKAAAESRGFELCARNGIPVPRVLAWAEDRRVCFLRGACAIEERLENAVRLADFLHTHSATMSSVNRAALMGSVGALLAKVHCAGISHPDFHPGNILVTSADPSVVNLFVVDLHSIRPLSLFRSRRRFKDLAKLYHSLCAIGNEADLRAALDGYGSVARGFRVSERTLVKRTRALEARRLKSRTVRCVKESSAFTKVHLDGIKGYRRRDWSDEELLLALHGHEEAKKLRDARLVKLSRRSYVTVVGGSPSRYTDKLVVKEPLLGLSLFGRRRTANIYRMRRAWLAAHAFTIRGLPVPEHLALVERRFFGIPYRAWLVLRFVEDALDLDHFLESHPTVSLAFFDQLAALVLRLFSTGMYHGDLSGKNILIAETKDGRWQFYFLDLESVVLWRRLTARRKAKNMNQLLRSLNRFCDSTQRDYFLSKLVSSVDRQSGVAMKVYQPQSGGKSGS